MSRVQKPLVILLGFLGSQPRHVNKYAKSIGTVKVNVAPLHETTKIHETTPEVIQYIPPVTAFFLPSSARKSSQELVSIVEQAIKRPTPLESLQTSTSPSSTTTSLQPRKIMFYLLSNNGSYGLSTFLTYIQKYRPDLYRQINSQTCGVIWDSAPSFPGPDVSSRGIISTICARLKLHPYPVLPVITPIVTGIFNALLALKDFKSLNMDIQRQLDHGIPFHVPQLFFLTPQDDLVSFEESQKYLETRGKQQNDFFNAIRQQTNEMTTTSQPNEQQTPNFPENLAKLAGHTSLTSFLQNNDANDQIDNSWDQDAVFARQAAFFGQYIAQQHVAPATQTESPSQDNVGTDPSSNSVTFDLSTLPNVDYLFDEQIRRQLSLEQDSSIAPLFDSQAQNKEFDKSPNQFVHVFSPSLHVQHIRQYPQEYSSVLSSFSKYAFRG